MNLKGKDKWPEQKRAGRTGRGNSLGKVQMAVGHFWGAAGCREEWDG